MAMSPSEREKMEGKREKKAVVFYFSL